MQQTVVILKPDVFIREERDEYSQLKKELPGSEIFVEYVKNKISDLDLEIVQERKEQFSEEIVIKHYKEHKNNHAKINSIINNMTFWPSCLLLIEWINSQEIMRNLTLKIREKFLQTPKVARRNMIHASANLEEAQYEAELHFK